VSTEEMMSRKPIEFRNPLASPALLAALRLLQPCAAPRLIDWLIRTGRIADAAAIAEQLIADADRP
jgi:hypothetical protein